MRTEAAVSRRIPEKGFRFRSKGKNLATLVSFPEAKVSRDTSCVSSPVGRFLPSLSHEALEDFDSLASVSRSSSGTALFLEGQLPSHALVLLDGRVKLSIDSREGRRLLLRIAERGEVLGFASVFTGRPYPITAETLHSCSVASIRRSDFLNFLERHPQACLNAAKELGVYHEQACSRLRTIGLTSCVRAKLARLILEWCARGARTKDGTSIHIPLTHGGIAECIGSRRETITRVLGDLQRRKIIRVHGTKLTVTDRQTLEGYAES